MPRDFIVGNTDATANGLSVLPWMERKDYLPIVWTVGSGQQSSIIVLFHLKRVLGIHRLFDHARARGEGTRCIMCTWIVSFIYVYDKRKTLTRD